MNRDSMLIEVDELLKKLGNENIRVFDATNTDDAYKQGHIPGAAYFDHGKFSIPDSPYECTILPMDKLIKQIGESGISNDSEVIVYACGMIPYAARAWWVLHYAGHDNVRVLNGGLSAWKNAGGQVEQASQRYKPVIFSGNPRPEKFADKEEVLAALKSKDVLVIDVLPPPSYEGAHITGSANISCMDLMQGMDYILPNDVLVSPLSETAQYKRIITYCGGGIAAAINAMAHVMVGQDNVAVYDGSLREWIGENLPITGTGKWAIWETNG
jgi:thiosulfate/3-mercaptopyruvate sulfurtransferase